MKRNLLQIGLTILLSSSLFGFTYEIKDGWQQVGAIQDIDDLSIFNNAGCVDHVWYYDNNNTSDPQWKLHIANGNTYNYCGETLTSLKKGQGFWVKATGECTITIDEPVCPTSNMPAPPDLENGTCDTTGDIELVTSSDINISIPSTITLKDILIKDFSDESEASHILSANTGSTIIFPLKSTGELAINIWGNPSVRKSNIMLPLNKLFDLKITFFSSNNWVIEVGDITYNATEAFIDNKIYKVGSYNDSERVTVKEVEIKK